MLASVARLEVYFCYLNHRVPKIKKFQRCICYACARFFPRANTRLVDVVWDFGSGRDKSRSQRSINTVLAEPR